MADTPPQLPPIDAEDSLVAVFELFNSLFALLVMADVFPLAKIQGLVQVTAMKLERDGKPKAAAIVSQVFTGMMNGEWDRMKKLKDAPASGPAS